MKKNRKYSDNFIRDVKWYLSVRHLYNFDGNLEREIVFDKNGVDGVHGFFLIDSQGKLKPTKHPNILRTLLKTKGSVNLHIKMYSEDRAKGVLPKLELDTILEEIKSPSWVTDAIEQQKYKFYSI